MFARGMFAGNRVGGVYGADTRCAMIRQSGAVTRQCGAARTGCCGVTAQAATRAVTTSASTHMSAATTTARVAASASASTPRVAATPAARGDAR
jgi:hypothetical protein